MILTAAFALVLYQASTLQCTAYEYGVGYVKAACSQSSEFTCRDDLCKLIEQSLREHPLQPPPQQLILTYTDADRGQEQPTNLPDHLRWSWNELTEFQGMKVLTIPGSLTLGKCKYPEDVTLQTMDGKGKVYCMHLLK